jgi:excisionase family DNA binding protein
MSAGGFKRRLMSVEEAAKCLGVSVKCIRGWIYRRSIPYYKIGRVVRIADETVEQIIERGLIPARDSKWSANHD